MLPAASVVETPQNVPWTNHPAPSQTDQTPLYSVLGCQRTDYALRPQHNRFVSFADTDYEMGQTSAFRKVYIYTRLYREK